jgi:hypothetical protein
MVDNLENEPLTEGKYLELAQEFQEQFNKKELILEKTQELLLHLLKGLIVGYSVLRMLDNYTDQMELEGPMLLVKKMIEMGRSELSDVVEEWVEMSSQAEQ